MPRDTCQTPAVQFGHTLPVAIYSAEEKLDANQPYHGHGAARRLRRGAHAGIWIVTTTDLAASTVTVEYAAPTSRILCDLNDVSIYDLAVGTCGEIGFSDAEHSRTRIERRGGNTLAAIHVMSYECTDED